MSSVAKRVVKSAGGSTRRTSSTAPAISDQSAREERELVGVEQQRPDDVGDEAHGGLEPGRDQQHRVGHLLVLAQDLAVGVGRLEGGEELGAAAVPARNEGDEERGQPLHVGDPALAGPAGRIEQGGHVGVPGGGVDAEQDARDLHRQPEAHHRHHVTAAPGLDVVDDAVGHGRDARAQGLDGTGRERPTDQGPGPPVRGAVEGHHPAVHDRPEGIVGDAEGVGHPLPRRQPGVAQERGHVVVAGDVPVAEVRLVHGVVLPETVEQRERVVPGLVGEELVGHRALGLSARDAPAATSARC